MLQSSTVLSPNGTKRTPLRVIKIKSPKSDIKIHNLNLNVSKNTSELASKGNISNFHNDEVDKITQSWNNLKVTALSKAIAIAPDVGGCTIGPNSMLSDLDCRKSDDVDCDKLDLSKAITSTPLKPPSYTRDDNMGSFNLSQSNRSHKSTSLDEESSKLETLRKICLNKIETYINNHVQRKRENILKAWEENDEKVKIMNLALKLELENERVLRIQEQNTAIQKVIMETEANNQVKAQQQQQIKFNYEKRIAERGEKLRQIDQKRKEVEEKRKKLDELKQCIDGIYEMHVAYNHKYCQIHEINKSCRDIRLLSEKVAGEVPKLKAMNELMLKLVEKSNEGKVSLHDLRTAEALVQQITIVSQIFTQHVDEVNNSVEKAGEEKKKEQGEKNLQNKQEVVQQETINLENQKLGKEKTKKNQSPEKLSFGVEDCISNESLKWHLELSKFLEDYEKKLEPLLSNDSFKKFRFDCQKAVNVPVNAISPLDDLHLQDKLYKLSRLLQGNATPLGNSLFLATGHPLGVSFCTNLLAKKFVKQGELTVSSKPEAAFAIAAVIVALWVDFPEFGRLLLAHFHRECPYLIPAFLPQVEGQSNEDYYRMLGYQYSEDGKVEAQDKFLRRMSGVMRLYAAILVTPLKNSLVAEGKRHPLHMKEAWRWFTATLNLSPRPDISPTLLFDFLEVTGGMLLKTYRAQFTKLLQFLCFDYFPKIEQVTPDGCGGPVTRLKSFLERILKEGRVPPPPGLLSSNFW